MPTGYTADVVDGKVTNFKTFALQCARAFGACIDMRDDPLDKPIPEKFDNDNYYSKKLKDAYKELEALNAMSFDDVSQACEKSYEDAQRYYYETIDRYGLENGRLEAMIQKVKNWNPPSNEHTGLKEFMLEQLEMSKTTYEPSVPVKESPQDWKERKHKELMRDIKYYGEEQAAEVARNLSRNQWIQLLRNSL